MKTLIQLSVFSLLIVFIYPISGYAADYKVGVVNPAKVLEASPQAEAARKKMEKEFATRDSNLVAMQNDLKELEDRFAKDGAIMSEAERQRLEREIVNKRRTLKRDTTEFQEDVNFRRNEEMGKIQVKIQAAIDALGKEQSFDMIFAQGVVYNSPKVDITDAVIDRLQKKSQ